MAIQRHLSDKRLDLAMPIDSTLTSIGGVGKSSLISRKIYSFGSDSNFDKKSAAVFNLPKSVLW